MGENHLHYQHSQSFSKKEECVVYLHGNSGSHKDFEKLSSLVDLPFINIDLPGHGHSPGLHQYSLKSLAKSVSSLINKLSLKSYHLVGHSLGGHVFINALKELEQSPKSLTLIGTPPLSQTAPLTELFKSPPESQILFKNIVTKEELEAYYNLAFSLSLDFDHFSTQFSEVDPSFRESLFQSLLGGEFVDELDILKTSQVKVNFILGDKDPLIQSTWINNCALELEESDNDTRLSLIPQSMHYPHLTNPQIIRDNLLEFFRNIDHSQDNGKFNTSYNNTQEASKNL